MPQFSYEARDEAGKSTHGTLRAANEDRATSLLRSHGLNPTSITLTEDETPFWQREFAGFAASAKDLILFTRQMASMIRAGVPIIETLKSLQEQVRKYSFKEVLQSMIYDVEAGDSLSNAMSKHPRTFSPFMLGVIRTGEVSGRLSESLDLVSEYIEQDYNFMRRVRIALTYPVFVLAVVVILVIIMFTFVLPQLVVLFDNTGVQLPWPTRALIAITNFMQSYWIILAGFIVLGVVLLRSYLKTPEGRYTLSTLVLRVPLINVLFQKLYLARLTSILYTLFSSNVPALESLALAKDAVGNKVYQRILDDTINAVKDGASISYVWRNEPYIPNMLTSMVSVGEHSGEVQKAFEESNRFFKQDVEEALDSIVVLLEPILIIVLAIGVGIVAGAVLLPIYNLVLVI